ncbi:MAG: PIN domain-containing protein [Acidimicrobiia bacterium]
MICDTSGLIAALAPDQPLSEECVSAMRLARDLVISPMVLTELDYLVESRHGQHAAIAVMRELSSGEYNIANFGASDLALAAEVMKTYADLRLGLADASLVVLAKRYNTSEILTLDQRHFRVVRSLNGRHFRLLPFDMD